VSARFIVGDVFDVLASLPEDSVDLVMTSPPFLALRSYLPADHPDKAKEIGSEAAPAEFLDTMLDVVEALDRVLAPHGSIVFELGDTYSGSGGAGGDYNERGMRDGQPKFSGSGLSYRKAAQRNRKIRQNHAWRLNDDGSVKSDTATRSAEAKNVEHEVPFNGGFGWPLDKSLCFVPELFGASLAYGRNLLRPERLVDPWRVRNKIAWVRPNPPVGALGDKFRPATSYLVVATKSRKRYFDLDAVREPGSANTHARTAKGVDSRSNNGKAANDQGRGGNFSTLDIQHKESSAPPLDYWIIPTAPYKGTHYATFPPALCVRPIKSMCPEWVCRRCGEPRRRRVEVDHVPNRSTNGPQSAERKHLDGGSAGYAVRADRHVSTVGWTDCGHGSVICRTCGLDWNPDAIRRSRNAQSVREGEEPGLLPEGSGACATAKAESSRDMSRVQGGVHGAQRPTDLQPEMRGATSGAGGSAEFVPEKDGEVRQQPRLRDGLFAGSPDGDRFGEEVGAGAPPSDGGVVGPTADERGNCPSPERSEGRQPNREPRTRDALDASGRSDLSPLPEPLHAALGDTCPRCQSSDWHYVTDNYRRGVVLDPFVGSGTTLTVATSLGRDAIGIDFDERNADLARDRVGMFLTVEHHPREAVS
jgi:DNA modification methylase